MSIETIRICLVAGEDSGDIYGAELARALKALAPGVLLRGVGGHRMEAEGVELLVGNKELGGIGLIEAHNKLTAVLKAYRKLKAHLASSRYDAVVCIDFPEFNLRLARAAKGLGHRVAYYVLPQLWAWRPWRTRLLARYVDKPLAVLPFEVAFYRGRGLKVEFVGHPMVDLLRPLPDKARFLESVGLDPGKPMVALLPGSRRAEVRYMLPTLRRAAELLFEERPDLQFLLPVAPTVRQGQVDHYLRDAKAPIVLLDGQAQEALASSDVALIVSGTATLEAALLGTPMVILYHGNLLSWLVVRALSRVSSYGLPNLIAGRPVVPELIQRQATPRALAREALRILDDPARRQTMVAELDKVRSLLGPRGTSQRAAQRILELCRR